MAEAAAAIPDEPVAAPAAVVRGRPVKRKSKAKGKAKGKNKTKQKKASAAAAGPDGQEIPKPKKEPPGSLRNDVEKEVGDRPIDDVIKEVMTVIDQREAAVATAQEAQADFEKFILERKTAMENATAAVEEFRKKEDIALAKYSADRHDLVNTLKDVAVKELAVVEFNNALIVLANECEQFKKQAHFIKAKEDAKTHVEDAKKSFQEAIAQSKQVHEKINAQRNALALTDDPDAAAKAQEAAEKAAVARKRSNDVGKIETQKVYFDIKGLAKAQQVRDKARAKAFKEAAGLCGAGKRKSVLGGAPPAKAAKIEDDDADSPS